MRSPGGAIVIDVRRQQRSFGDGFLRETVDELWEGLMRQADAILKCDCYDHADECAFTLNY